MASAPNGGSGPLRGPKRRRSCLRRSRCSAGGFVRNPDGPSLSLLLKRVMEGPTSMSVWPPHRRLEHLMHGNMTQEGSETFSYDSSDQLAMDDGKALTGSPM